VTTARDYTLLSGALRKAKGTGWEGACREIAKALKQRNPLFDKQRFMRECEGAVATEGRDEQGQPR
jgi:hypothetical protein